MSQAKPLKPAAAASYNITLRCAASWPAVRACLCDRSMQAPHATATAVGELFIKHKNCIPTPPTCCINQVLTRASAEVGCIATTARVTDALSGKDAWVVAAKAPSASL